MYAILVGLPSQNTLVIKGLTLKATQQQVPDNLLVLLFHANPHVLVPIYALL